MIIEASGRISYSHDRENESKNDIFTEEDAQILYEETKNMIKEMLDESNQQADNVLAQAQKEAEHILANTELQTQQLLEESRKQGFDNGFKAGREEALKQAEDHLRLFKEKLAEVEALKEMWLKENGEKIVLLAVNIAEKIINTTLSKEPQIINNIVEEIMKNNPLSGNVIIKVHPENYQYVVDNQALLGKFVIDGKLTIESESILKPGGCLIISSHGYIDSQIDDKLEQLKSALLKVVEV